MPVPREINLFFILRNFWLRVSVTWLLVLVENALLSIITLFIGFAIDGLLSGKYQKLVVLAAVLLILVVVATLRRFYDTRVYGRIRIKLGSIVNELHQQLPISTQNARLDMSHELVDFLENDIPNLLTALVQMIVVFIVLYHFHFWLGTSVVGVTLLTIGIYSCFHHRFFQLNAVLNAQTEQQVTILGLRNQVSLTQHLNKLRNSKVKISDTEAISFGLIFFVQSLFIIVNLWLSTQFLETKTAGKIFTIISYSWEYVEVAFILPMALQNLSRLQEIIARINKTKE